MAGGDSGYKGSRYPEDGSAPDLGRRIVVRNRRTVIASGILLGIGFAGLVDTVIFHEILQWHHVVSNVVSPTNMDLMRFNIFADGVFLAFTLAAIVAGISLLLGVFARQHPPSLFTRFFVGLLLLGFGLFNTFDGIVNHFILGIHHVRDGPDPLFTDLTFLVVAGFAFIAVGSLLVKQGYNVKTTTSAPATSASA